MEKEVREFLREDLMKGIVFYEDYSSTDFVTEHPTIRSML